MNYTARSIIFISDSVLNLSIALTAVSIFAFFLLLILILLGASKNFRAFFFREQVKKKTRKPAKSDRQAKSENEAPPPDGKPRSGGTKKQYGLGKYSSVPTVPLNIPLSESQTQKAPARKAATKRSGDIPTIELPRDNENTHSTYTTRSITITRAQGASEQDTSQSRAKNAQKKERSHK